MVMEMYLLDELYRRREVVDTYESFIWTERYSSAGDFQLVVNSTVETRSLLAIGMLVGMNESLGIMIIENIENNTDDSGINLLKITGRSVESMLEHRVARPMNLAPATPKWVLQGTPADIVWEIFRTICVYTDPNYIGDRLEFGTFNVFPPDTIALPTDVITVEIAPQSVYKAIKDICDLYELGFRMYRDWDTGYATFNVYSGSDRTTSQNALKPVIFSPALDNLASVTELKSIEKYKNVAYVFSPVGQVVVYTDGASATTSGLNRRVLAVVADDVTELDATTTTRLLKKGKEALAECKSLVAFDGELSEYTEYRYSVDYFLGDLIEMRNADGVTNRMRVTEQIFVSDATGYRTYPTLAIDLYITPGSWLAWDHNQVWNAALGVWETV